MVCKSRRERVYTNQWLKILCHCTVLTVLYESRSLRVVDTYIPKARPHAIIGHQSKGEAKEPPLAKTLLIFGTAEPEDANTLGSALEPPRGLREGIAAFTLES